MKTPNSRPVAALLVALLVLLSAAAWWYAGKTHESTESARSTTTSPVEPVKPRVDTAPTPAPAAAAQVHPTCDGCNLLVVVIDTLRADHLPCYGHVRDTAPNLCAFAKENIRFSHMFANGPSTKPSVASFFTSTFPRQHKTFHNEQALSARFVTLAEVMQKAGFDTVGVNANPVIGEKFGYSQGFRRWVDLDREDAEIVNQSVAAELDTLKKRFFLYVHYLDPHNPYRAPAPYDTYFTKGRGKARLPKGKYPRPVPPDFPAEDLEVTVLHYDNEIRYVDDEFGKLLAMIKAKGLYDDTVILVVSDHGEQFGEHGYFLHSNGVHAEVINVPLMLRIPRGDARGVVMDPYVQHIDLLPTLTKLLGVTDDAPRMGASVFDVPARRPMVMQHLRKADLAAEGIIDGELKLIQRLRADDEPWRLYDIGKDPGEKNDLLAGKKTSPEADALAAKLESLKELQAQWTSKHLQAAEGGKEDEEGENVELDAKDMARLRALGYAQ